MDLEFDDVTLRVVTRGTGRPVVFAHSLGLASSMWDAVWDRLPLGLRLISYDARGHGASSVPPGPYAMGALVRDAERVCDALDVRDAVFVGLSMGGLVAQGLAVKRPDLMRAMVLSNTGLKIGTAEMWADRAQAVLAAGMESIADGTLDRWFPKDFDRRAVWRKELCANSAEGYAATCAAIGGADFITPTSGLRLPTLAIAGGKDGATPPDMLREIADLIPGSTFALIHRAGHIPPVDQPDAFAMHLTEFLTAQGHFAP